MVNEILRRRDRTPVEGGDPACEHIDEFVQLRVREGPVNVSVSFRCLAVEVVRAENDFEGATTADQQRKAFRATAARMQPHADFGLTKSRVLARREPHIAGEDELAAYATDEPRILTMLTTGEVVRRTNVSISRLHHPSPYWVSDGRLRRERDSRRTLPLP